MSPESADYDSTADTLKHARRVAELMADPAADLIRRAATHDQSKIEEPELSVFNEYTPKLRDSTFGSDDYRGFLKEMGEGLAHHYAHNRHHPEHFEDGVGGMNLVDLIEMLADWKAAGERHANGSMRRSLTIQPERFGIGAQLARVLWNTADHFGWLDSDAAALGEE